MDQEFYINLIIKKLSEEISETEKSELELWLKADVQNIELSKSIEKNWHQSTQYKNSYQPNKTKAWANIEASIGKNQKITPLNPVYKWTSIAAALVILLAIGWFLNANFNSTTTLYTRSQKQMDITLPDGSLVVLNENSSIAYKKKFKTRNVQLKGEAYFDVEHNPQKPFKVIANSTETTVLGTTFNVSAYGNDVQDNVDVALFTGKIAFKAKSLEQLILNPGEKISFNTQTAQLIKETITNQNAIAWQTGTLTFEQANLTEVVAALEKYYNKKINLILPEDESCVFTGKFEKISFEKVIEILAFTFDLSTQDNNDQFTLTIKSCK